MVWYQKMKVRRRIRVSHGIFAMLVCCASCWALAQNPTKLVYPPQSASETESLKASSAYAAKEMQLRQQLEKEPNSAEILYKLGEILRFENKPKESLTVYTQAAHIQRPDAEQLRSVALDYVMLDDYNDAVHWLETAASLYPQNANVFYSLGRCYYSQNRFHDAEAMFLKVLQIKPDHLKAEENLGLVYDFDNQPEKAEAALRNAATWAGNESSDEWPFLDLGGFLLDHDRFAEAIPFLRRAAEIAPKCSSCHMKLGRALVATKDAKSGVQELEIAVQLDPNNAKIHFELGRAYRSAGDAEKSRAEFALSQSLYGQHSNN